jgi:hypothetical protein
MSFLFVLPGVTEVTGTCHHVQPLAEMGSQTVCLDWLWTSSLLSHCAWPHNNVSCNNGGTYDGNVKRFYIA